MFIRYYIENLFETLNFSELKTTPTFIKTFFFIKLLNSLNFKQYNINYKTIIKFL